MLSCLQEIEDGFDILDATDYGPYPNIDKVSQTDLMYLLEQRLKSNENLTKRTSETMRFFHCHPVRSLNQARWVIPTKGSGSILQNQNSTFSPQMQPLEMILGFNKDEGLHVIIDLLMDPTNDTNFRLVI